MDNTSWITRHGNMSWIACYGLHVMGNMSWVHIVGYMSWISLLYHGYISWIPYSICHGHMSWKTCRHVVHYDYTMGTYRGQLWLSWVHEYDIVGSHYLYIVKYRECQLLTHIWKSNPISYYDVHHTFYTKSTSTSSVRSTTISYYDEHIRSTQNRHLRRQ